MEVAGGSKSIQSFMTALPDAPSAAEAKVPKDDADVTSAGKLVRVRAPAPACTPAASPSNMAPPPTRMATSPPKRERAPDHGPEAGDVDQGVLAELPPELRREIEAQIKLAESASRKGSDQPTKRRKAGGPITQFFGGGGKSAR